MASFAGAPAAFFFFVLFFFSSAVLSGSSSGLNEQFQPSWANDHVIYDGELLKLKLDSLSGSGLASKGKYIYGKATAEMKLVPGDSAGTVTAFYMSSEGDAHNEFDFEFLGNSSGEPYLVQTNVYVNGEGNREQRMGLWFDPTEEFHGYSIHWSPKRVVFMVDDTPIRVFDNNGGNGGGGDIAGKPMGVYSSIWDADDWATQGGRVKIDWSHAPFVATYLALRVDGCEAAAEAAMEAAEARRCGRSWRGVVGGGAPEMEMVEELSVHQSHQLEWVRARHLVYDYCFDSERFPQKPPECVH